jgi:hypothetical protein
MLGRHWAIFFTEAKHLVTLIEVIFSAGESPPKFYGKTTSDHKKKKNIGSQTNDKKSGDDQRGRMCSRKKSPMM